MTLLSNLECYVLRKKKIIDPLSINMTKHETVQEFRDQFTSLVSRTVEED